MLTQIRVHGDKIASQIVRYQVTSDSAISKDVISKLEDMKESEFIAYAKEMGIRIYRMDT